MLNAIDQTGPTELLSSDDSGLFRVIFEQAAVGVAQIQTATGRFLRVNQRYCDILGYPRVELEQLDYQTLTHPADLTEDMAKMRRLVSGEIREFTVEKRYQRKDGRIVWVNLTVSPLWAPGEPPNYHVAVVEDITERKRAEEAEKAARRLLSGVLDTVPVRVFWKDLSGRYLGCNLPFAQDAGFDRPEDLAGKTDFELAWREQADAYRRDDRQVVSSGTAKIGYEEPQASSGGNRLWLRTSKIPLKDSHGETIGVLGTYEDITERKRKDLEREKLQAQLTQAQKMESVGRLAGGVAHDFNNMLQAILGHAALALEEIPEDSPVRESLEEITKAGQRSADLTRQLLAFARKQTIQPIVLDLNDTVSGMLKMLRRLIGENIDLAWKPGANLWRVKVDPSQIDQILANLCVNARDAIEGAGKVTIETQNSTLDDTYATTQPDCVPGPYVVLAVSDSGKGIDAETRAHLFEPFFTTKEVGQGTGLGLATVFGIVKQNQGLISVYSEPGHGTTFKIYLPRAQTQPVVEEKTAERAVRRGSETVLLVEDEEQVLNLGLRILKQLGHRVLCASTPRAALEIAAGHAGPIHLLITDVVMPVMNGKELRDRLQSSHPELKCLFMSGYTADVIAHHGVLDEGVAFLEKPFTKQILAEKIRAVLD